MRLALAVAALALAVLLLTAWQLVPRTEGLGTHQQLGLPPCSVRMLWGMRCPACGMTTSWAYFMRGQLASSAATNAGGFALALLAVAVVPVASTLAVTGRPAERWMLPSLVIGLTLALAISLTDWVWRVWV